MGPSWERWMPCVYPSWLKLPFYYYFLPVGDPLAHPIIWLVIWTEPFCFQFYFYSVERLALIFVPFLSSSIQVPENGDGHQVDGRKDDVVPRRFGFRSDGQTGRREEFWNVPLAGGESRLGLHQRQGNIPVLFFIIRTHYWLKNWNLNWLVRISIFLPGNGNRSILFTWQFSIELVLCVNGLWHETSVANLSVLCAVQGSHIAFEFQPRIGRGTQRSWSSTRSCQRGSGIGIVHGHPHHYAHSNWEACGLNKRNQINSSANQRSTRVPTFSNYVPISSQ